MKKNKYTKAFFRKVYKNMSIDLIRAQQKNRIHLVSEIEAIESLIPYTETPVDKLLERKQRLLKIKCIMDRLSEKDRAILLIKYGFDLAFKLGIARQVLDFMARISGKTLVELDAVLVLETHATRDQLAGLFYPEASHETRLDNFRKAAKRAEQKFRKLWVEFREEDCD